MIRLFHSLAFMVTCFSLAACSGPEDRYLLPAISGVQTYQSSVRTVEVSTINLPAYAEDTEISILGADGVMRPTKSGFWADSPDRALTEMLAVGLDQALNASVATAPWPFDTPPDVQVSVKVINFSGVPGESLKLSGQYFLTSPAHGHLEKAYRFSYAVPMADDSLTAVAAAQTEAIKKLVNDVARRIAKK